MAEENGKGLLANIAINAKAIDDKSFENFPRGTWPSLKAMWGDNLSRIVIMSFIALLFFTPAIAWIVIAINLAGNVNTAVPFSMFDFIGYVSPTAAVEGLKTAEIIGNIKFFENAMFEFSVLIPAIGIAAVGVGGLFYVARIFAHKDKTMNMFKGLFVGVRYTWLPALITGTLTGAAVFLLVFTIYVFDAYSLSVVGKVFAIIGACLVLAFSGLYCLYSLALSSTYKMKIGDVLKDSLKLTVGSFLKNIIFLFFAALGVGLMILAKFFLSNFYTLMWTIMFMLGVFFYVSLFSALSHQTFDFYVNSETEHRAQALVKEKEMAARERNRQERLEKKASGEPKKKAQQPVKFTNPKKKKKQEGAEKPVSEIPAARQTKKGGYSESELRQIEEDRKAVLNSAKPDDGFDASAYEDSDE